MSYVPPDVKLGETSLDFMTEKELIAASGDAMGLLVEGLATVMTDEQWTSIHQRLENALASYSQLLLTSEKAN